MEHIILVERLVKDDHGVGVVLETVLNDEDSRDTVEVVVRVWHEPRRLILRIA